MKEEKTSLLAHIIPSDSSKLMDAWRASRLNPVRRKLRKYNVVDDAGYLTAFGVRMYLDYLFEKDTAAQKEIGDSLAKVAQEDKKDK